MKSKKIICYLLLSVLLISLCCSSFVSSASVYYVDGQAITTPGQTKTYIPLDKFNYAWIDDVVVRDSSSSVTALTLVPVTSDPYSHTLTEFIEECNNYTDLFDVSDEVLESTFVSTLTSMYYTLIATGVITETNSDMRAYNEEHGIIYPYMASEFANIYTAIVYVSLRTDLYGAILDKQIEIPRGTTVEGAVVKILSAACGMELPGTVNTISAFSYLFAEDYVIDENEYPVSDEPTEEEVYYWVRLAAADEAGYSVPADIPYDSVTAEQEEYVTYAYYASILTQRYEIMVDPLLLRAALLSSDPETQVPQLVLKAMLDHVSIEYDKNESIGDLFEKAKKEGFFDLEAEFYTDIYDYEVFVEPDCEEVWFTSYIIADQLVDADESNAVITLNGNEIRNCSTTGVKLDAANKTKVVIDVKYNDGERNDKATYTFTVKRDYNASEVNGNLNIDIADPVNSVLDSLSGAADSYLGSDITVPTLPNTYPTSGNTLTTYATDGAPAKEIETYPTDANGEIINNSGALDLSGVKGTTEAQPLNVSFAEAVKENPEYVATPIGLIAIGASAGYIFFKRKKEYDTGLNDNEISVDDIEL